MHTRLQQWFTPILYIVLFFAGFLTAFLWFNPRDYLQNLAATLTALRNAQATSIETRVRMAQPGLDADAVQAEVERIKAEEGIVTDPTGGFV